MIQGHFIFEGKVQGVSFRFHTQVQATKLGLCGTVKNLSDGSVEVFVQGPEKQVKELLKFLKSSKGPGLVSRVHDEYCKPKENFVGFEVIY